MKALRLVVTLACLLGLVTLLVGCGSGSDARVFLTLFQRASWSPEANGRLALAAYGGNGLLYVYSMTPTGGGLFLMTPSLNDKNNLLEGGQHPSHSPSGDRVAFVSRRAVAGNTGNSLALYTMSAQLGDKAGLVKITSDTTSGADTQPNWSPDGTRIIYSTTRVTGIPHLRAARADGSGEIGDILNDGEANEWPCFNPLNPNQIVYQSTRDQTAPDATGIFIYDIAAATYTPIAVSQYADGGPSWSPDGSMIAFHSNRSGDYDLYIWRLADSALLRVTNDSRSDGFPVWNADGTRLAFTRDRELWTTNLDGTDQKQLTARF
jgi:Tol biopolymer transport system component